MLNVEVLTKAYRVVDVDNSGVLDWKEFLALMKNATHEINQV